MEAEAMVDELEDLEKRGLFTNREIKEISKQRERFEYKLLQPEKKPEDYLDYIEYETNFEKYLQLRKRVLEKYFKKKMKMKMKISISDFASVNRITGIYKRLLSRFEGDIDLWFRYLEFCKARRNEKTKMNMKEALVKCVRLHPKVPRFWIYAANWEFGHNLNIEAARVFMYFGLRFCPTSEDLWIAYLRMELTYLNKLKAPKVAPGKNEGTLIRCRIITDEKQWRDENKDLLMFLDDNSEVSKKQLYMFTVAERGMPFFQTVYRDAVEALPSSFRLRKRFVEILDEGLANSEEMHKKIIKDMKGDFATKPEFWDWFARLECDLQNIQETREGVILPQVQNAVQIYDEALEVVHSVTMFNMSVQFLMDVIAKTKRDSNYILDLLKVQYGKAETMGFITGDLDCQHISEKICKGKLTESAQSSIPSDADLLAIFELLEGILKKLPISKSLSLWKMALKLFAGHKKYFDMLVEMSTHLLSKNGGSENGSSLSSLIVNFVLQKFLPLPHPGLAFYKNCIDLESNCVGDKDGLANARNLYESALATYHQNVDLWRDYYLMEMKMSKSDKATAISYRARKALNVDIMPCKEMEVLNMNVNSEFF
ncbi:U3 small nucleolar RNA-associated protein 6-like protein [Quillaja saponaria]|uniref:U3 small nucleolar RNA-associated protein 6-like protein n=1 Tax=Quillaja saponaria TaxID=32244 RepID=A0AAD7PU19_QUISA|nr:U3 small nucleolar RNA-associated protein 6-like protein [Quillaja saponaria]